MTGLAPGGCFFWARKVFKSPIWGKRPIYFKAFFWLVGRAVFEDGYTLKGHTLKRGQLITTYSEIADALAYHVNRAIVKPTKKEIRIVLAWLESEGMILMKPLIGGTLPNQGTPLGRTRAYIGTLITIVNYDTYQRIESYKGTHQGTPLAEPGQTRERMKRRNDKIFLSDSTEIRLSELLFEKILSRNPKYKKADLQTWAKNIDLMRRVDGRTPEDIRAVILWCQSDPFWQSNILSTGKLREKFDQLQMKMGIEDTKGSVDNVSRPSTPDGFTCPRCSKRIVVKADLTPAGCVYCEMAGREPAEVRL